jgi:endonuclease-3
MKMDMERFLAILEQNHSKWKPPSVTAIADEGAGPFEVLVSTLLSLRTKDEVTLAASRRLLKKARTPEQILALSEEIIRETIYPVGFYPTKAKRLREISREIIERFGGNVPDRLEELLSLPGVGRKTANLVLIEGFGQDAICVDTHVHRISNRIGYVRTRNPEETEQALRKKLPRKHWNRYNERLVAFGQALCRPVSPLCSQCPVAGMCPRVGVGKSR